MDCKKKLLITASTFPRYEGDTEPRFILDYAKAMTKYYDVTVMVPSFPGAKITDTLEGVRVIRYRYFFNRFETLCYPGAIVPRIKEKKTRALLVPFVLLSLYIHLLRISKDYDLIHANWFVPQAVIHSFIRKPYLITGLGGDVTSLNKGVFYKLKNRAIKKSSGLVVVSERLKRVLIDTYPSAREKEIQVIPMGCNTKAFSPSNRVQNFYNQNENRVILFVGRLVEKKGAKFIIEAMKYVDGATLYIVGDGPLRENLKQQCKAMELESKVVFLGAKSSQELKTLYASADVLCAPSVVADDGDEEGLPVATLEAMASGIPVVASDSGGYLEIIKDGVNGFIVKQRDSRGLAAALKELLGNQEVAEQFVRKSREIVESYDYDHIASAYAAFFRKAFA